MICAVVSAAVLLRYEHASISARTMRVNDAAHTAELNEIRTLQSVNSPLFKLLKRYLCSRRCVVEVQSIWVVLLLENRCSKLLLFRVKDSPSLGINFIELLTDHFEFLEVIGGPVVVKFSLCSKTLTIGSDIAAHHDAVDATPTRAMVLGHVIIFSAVWPEALDRGTSFAAINLRHTKTIDVVHVHVINLLT